MKKIEHEQLRNQAKGWVAIRQVFENAAKAFFFFPAVRAAIEKKGQIFTFRKNPIVNRFTDKLLIQMSLEISLIMKNGAVNSWRLGEALHEAEILQKISPEVGSLLRERAVFAHRAEAMQEFTNRVTGGLKLSDRVWNLSQSFKPLLEKTVQIGMTEGKGALQMISQLRVFLKNPEIMQAKVTALAGELPFSPENAVFHPGRGVYRSPEKNCRRMYANETNVAYRQAYSMQAQQNPVVVGFEIQLSDNHTINGVPFVDVCDHLKGRYPKTFNFTGWHVLCKCHALSILCTREELNKFLEGEATGTIQSRNEVKQVPAEFTKWIQDNADRSKNWKSQPNFIQDNFKGGKIQGGLL